ncbi:hypothetical protein ACLOJK_029339 [Asimina triloba]
MQMKAPIFPKQGRAGMLCNSILEVDAGGTSNLWGMQSRVTRPMVLKRRRPGNVDGENKVHGILMVVMLWSVLYGNFPLHCTKMAISLAFHPLP